MDYDPYLFRVTEKSNDVGNKNLNQVPQQLAEGTPNPTTDGVDNP